MSPANGQFSLTPAPSKGDFHPMEEGFAQSAAAQRRANRCGPRKILLIAQEFRRWRQARHWSYCVQLGLEEGLKANGAEFFTLTTPWLARARDLCAGKQFDQVWLDVVHSLVDDPFLDWCAGMAPVRVGFLGESLEYTPEECALSRDFAPRKRKVEQRLRYLTHVLAVDEHDVAQINARRLAPALWWPQAVPERFVSDQPPACLSSRATFSGALYGERAGWLERLDLKGLLGHQPSPEAGTLYPAMFRAIHQAACAAAALPSSCGRLALPAYLYMLRRLRRRCFARWLQALAGSYAVVNLPSCLKAYPGRVVESMAVGRPVVSWAVPDRPQTRILFEDGREILLFPKEDPAQLVEHLQRLRAEPGLARRVAENAGRKLRRFHTIEQRVRQILDWVEREEMPLYC